MKELVETLSREFNNKEYAHSYMEEISNISLATQIKVLREQRGWTQEELADKSGMKQERISKIEDINYGSWTAKTLRKLAEAFDVNINISFEKFSTGITRASHVNREYLEVPSRTQDLIRFSSNNFKLANVVWASEVVHTTKARPILKIAA